LFELPVFLDKKQDNLVIVTPKNTKYVIQELPKKLKSKRFLFANQVENNYKTDSGGQVFYPKAKDFLEYNSELETETISKNGKILFVPQETHIINRDKSLLIVPNQTKLENPGTELINDIFSKTNGFLETKESNQILQEITIKPGEFFEYKKLAENEIKQIKELNQKIYFPGEIIFDDILVNYLTLLEIVEIQDGYGIILRPIQEFNIAKPNSKELEQSLNQTNKIRFKTISSLTSRSTSKTKKKESFNLVESSIWTENLDEIENTKTTLIYNVIPDKKNSEIYNLALMTEEKINISNFLSKKLIDEKLKLTLCVKNYQYLEPQTVIGLISTTPKNNLEIKQIKKSNERSEQILLVGKENYQTYDNNGSFFYPKKGDMVKVGDKISPLLKVDYSGKVIQINSKTLTIHKATPFFVTEGTTLYKKSNDFIKKEELLGTITFEQIVTGDIVQGLPKVEEILEARKPQNPALLSENAGVIKKISNSEIEKISTIEMLGNTNTPNVNLANSGKKQTINYTINRKKTGKAIIVKKNDYIYVGQPLTEGSVNPHNLLVTYFNYYKNFGNDYEAAYQSFKNVQLLLIQKVQQVYNSQGVDIADKHLEIIIKRITSKVQINKTGGSFLLPGELIELKQIQYINEILENSNKILATYQPILLGITKASLVTDSFISAASFQETTKILTAAAIEGKIDWLRGLKENVIIGRLIPVGTGFKQNTNKKVLN
jgi:DNA-directed RNA polymerase subunit beta'